MIVYKITNIINNKLYIGCTSQKLKNRWRQHNNPNSRRITTLTNAIKKYGISNFIIEEIDRLQSEEEMFMREIYWIEFYKSNLTGIGYNMTKGGEARYFNDQKEDSVNARKIINGLDRADLIALYGKRFYECLK